MQRPSVTSWNDTSKGFEVEEWADRRFFRPVGFRLARALYPTRVSADHVTAASLALGLVAGHLLFYTSARLNLAGVALFVASDLLDSADGQLARMRRTSSRAGRILDGVSDNVRFINLYLHLLARLVVAGWAWEAASALVLAAAVSHSFQSGAVDFVRNAYLWLGLGRQSELELADPAPRTETVGSFRERITELLYRDYLRRQWLLFPQTARLLSSLGGASAPGPLQAAWRQGQTATLPMAAWIGQNIRFALLLFTACLGWPAGLLWITAGPLNAVLAAVVLLHERNAALLLSPADHPSRLWRKDSTGAGITRPLQRALAGSLEPASVERAPWKLPPVGAPAELQRAKETLREPSVRQAARPNMSERCEAMTDV